MAAHGCHTHVCVWHDVELVSCEAKHGPVMSGRRQRGEEEPQQGGAAAAEGEAPALGAPKPKAKRAKWGSSARQGARTISVHDRVRAFGSRGLVVRDGELRCKHCNVLVANDADRIRTHVSGKKHTEREAEAQKREVGPRPRGCAMGGQGGVAALARHTWRRGRHSRRGGSSRGRPGSWRPQRRHARHLPAVPRVPPSSAAAATHVALANAPPPPCSEAHEGVCAGTSG